MIYFTSDWHIGHENVLRFDNRPFNSLKHMHETLVYNYNQIVKPSDICYFLGDIAFKNNEESQSIISKLNGTKILIRGNHDPGVNSCYDMGFDVVLHGANIQLGKTKITMLHCPLMGVPRELTEDGSSWHNEHKFSQFSMPDYGQYHVHGHCHFERKDRIRDRQFEVGVRANRYEPVSMSEIESWIMKREGYK